MNFENQLKECDELYEKQDYEALIEKCDEILGQFPYNPDAICYKGVSLHKLGETDEALNTKIVTEVERATAAEHTLKVDLINELLADFIKLTNINKVSTVNSLINFIKEKGFLSDDFLEEINYKVVVEIIEDVFNLQLVEELCKRCKFIKKFN